MKIGDKGYTIGLLPCNKNSSLLKIKIKSFFEDHFTGELLEGDYKGWSVYNSKKLFWKTKKEYNKTMEEFSKAVKGDR